MNFFSSLRVRPKMLITFITAIIAVMMCVAYINSKILKNALNGSLNSFHKMITEIAASSIKAGLEFDDAEELASVLGSFKKQDIISYIKVLDKDGKEMLLYRKDGLKELKKIENISTEVFNQIPVISNGEKIGTLIVGLSLEKSNKAQGSAAMWVFILSIIMIGFYTGVTLLSAEKIVRPIERITHIAEEIAKGDLDQEIIIDRKDEIGLLEASFYLMIDAQRDKAESAKQIAQGNLDIEIHSLSENDVLGKAMISMKNSIESVITDVNSLANAAMEGQFNKRADSNKHQGMFKSIVDGMNNTLDSITRPFVEATNVLKDVAARNLTARMTGEYKGEYQTIKGALNIATKNLDTELQQVALAADQVTQAANQIGSGSQAVAQGASEQASSLEQISSNMQEMASITLQNASNSTEAKNLADFAKTGAEKGVKSMNRLSDAISKIKISADETAKIIKTIDDIAFQTNLLALNAAVEAARAGDAGKGFAVVAEEVRNLAIRSAEAAKTTSNLIEESVKNAEDGVKLNQEVLNNFNEITEQIHKVGKVMSDIASASNQQSEGVQNVNTGIEQMNQVTQQTAANSEESASTAQQLAQQAEKLRHMVASFTLSEANNMMTVSSIISNDEYAGEDI